MNHLDSELLYLRDLAIEMMELVRDQFEKSRKALIGFDLDLAEEIVRAENRVNALELNIEKECENIIALFQPVATDLRFVLSILKSVSELERIGDHADGIARFLLDRQKAYEGMLLEESRVSEMYLLTLNMFDDIILSLRNKDSERARRVFKKDKEVNRLFRKAVDFLAQVKSEQHEESRNILILYSTVARLERTGDLLTNIAEEIIFYLEAEVIKHSRKGQASLG